MKLLLIVTFWLCLFFFSYLYALIMARHPSDNELQSIKLLPLCWVNHCSSVLPHKANLQSWAVCRQQLWQQILNIQGLHFHHFCISVCVIYLRSYVWFEILPPPGLRQETSWFPWSLIEISLMTYSKRIIYCYFYSSSMVRGWLDEVRDNFLSFPVYKKWGCSVYACQSYCWFNMSLDVI